MIVLIIYNEPERMKIIEKIKFGYVSVFAKKIPNKFGQLIKYFAEKENFLRR